MPPPTRSPTACARPARRCAPGSGHPAPCWGAGSPARRWPPSACCAPCGSSRRCSPATSRSSSSNRRSRSATAATCSASSAAICSCSPSTRWPASRASSPAARCRCRPSTTTASRAGFTNTAGASRSASSCSPPPSRSARRRTCSGTRSPASPASCTSRPACCCSGLLPHAILELTALFLPLAAWIIASRRGEWDQLLAATFVTVAIAVPMLVVAALIEVYISPHLFTTLTGIHPPIVRYSEGWLVTVR